MKNLICLEKSVDPVLWLWYHAARGGLFAQEVKRSAYAALVLSSVDICAAGRAVRSREEAWRPKGLNIHRWPSQRYAGQPDRTGHRAGRVRAEIHAVEGIRCERLWQTHCF